MARLLPGEKSGKGKLLQNLLNRHEYGLRETEIANELGWDRRTVNNYLRELAQRGQIYKEGRTWFTED